MLLRLCHPGAARGRFAPALASALQPQASPNYQGGPVTVP